MNQETKPKPKIKRNYKSLYKTKGQKNLSTSKTKEIEKILLNQKKIFFNQKSFMIMMTLNTQ